MMTDIEIAQQDRYIERRSAHAQVYVKQSFHSISPSNNF